jgi:hypothetical protein
MKYSPTRESLFSKAFNLIIHYMSRELDGRNYVTSIIGTRIRFILESVSNPQMVAIHALWYISKITTAEIGQGNDFLGVSIFNHLHCCGAATFDELLFSAFVVVARLADKMVNDAFLPSKAWCVRPF